MSTISIKPLASDQTDAAARLLSRAFVTNPLHVAVFGEAQLGASEEFFRIALAVMKGPKLVAMDDARMVGVLHWVLSPACRFSGAERLRMMPVIVKGLGFSAAVKVSSWLSEWAKFDPAEPHSHLGPIGVDPEAQGRHIGHQMMNQYCSASDDAGVTGYLETDRPGNVDFYRRFGFEVIATLPILGIPNYLMRRPLRHNR